MFVKLMTRASLALAPMAVAGIAEAQAPPPPSAPPSAVTRPFTGYFSISGGYEGETDFGYGGGMTIGHTSVPSGFGVQGAWGGRFANGLRAEVGMTYANHSDATTVYGATSGGDGLWTFSLDGNVYFDTAPNQPVNFYVGGGVGIVGFHIDDGVFDESVMSGPSVQGIVGLEFKTSPTLRLFTEGRIRGMWVEGEDDLGNTYDTNTTIASFNAGLRFLY
jgi:opacity protein-like surface antigen